MQLFLAWLTLAFAYTLLPMASAAITTLLLYPIWSWRRHEIAWKFITQELTRIDLEGKASQFQQIKVAEHEDTLSPLKRLELVLNGRVVDDPNATSLAIERNSSLSRAEQQLLADLDAQITNPPDNIVGSPPGEVLAAQIRRLETRAQEVRQGRAIGLAGLGNMSNGALILTALGEIQFANPAAKTLLKLDSAQSNDAILGFLNAITPPLGSTWLDIMRGVVLEHNPIAFEGLTAEGIPVFVAAQPLARDIETEMGEGSAAILGNNANTQPPSSYAPFWVLTLSDLTAIRSAQAQREEALAFLSHDIRSPLLSVLALIRGSNEKSQLLDDISNYTQKGLSTSDQFLQLSRLQLQGDFEKYEVEVDQFIHNAMEQVFFLGREKNITFHFHAATTDNQQMDGVWTLANGELLERALVNLFSNAIKYSDENTQVDISMGVEPDGEARQATIIIQDQGYGIPQEELQFIFEPYFRSAEQKLAENRGAGLGLRFVKTVIDRHKGQINVESEWGKGTRFIIRLPLTSVEFAATN